VERKRPCLGTTKAKSELQLSLPGDSKKCLDLNHGKGLLHALNTPFFDASIVLYDSPLLQHGQIDDPSPLIAPQTGEHELGE
jgi:hypothetical protein